MMGIPSTNCYGAACTRLYPTRVSAAAQTGSVPPVTPVPAVGAAGRDTNMGVVVPKVHGTALPPIREGVDPVAMAVRGRIQYPEDAAGQEEAAGVRTKAEEKDSPYETMQEAECQTCENRKYQDGSNDPGVSFKTATRLTPEQAATAVRGHEMEHVSHERARAEREDRKIVQQSVTIHTSICPECGDVYISGGTTRTTTAKDNRQELAQQARQDMLGRTLDTFA